MPPLTGSHYCSKHQGNHSHYAEENCELCKAQAEIDRLHDLLIDIGNRAHHASTGPALPDEFWEIRSIAYDGINATDQRRYSVR